MSAAETWALRLLLLILWPVTAVLILGLIALALIACWVMVLCIKFEPQSNRPRD